MRDKEPAEVFKQSDLYVADQYEESHEVLNEIPYLDIDEQHVKIKVRLTKDGYAANYQPINSYSNLTNHRGYISHDIFANLYTIAVPVFVYPKYA